MVALLSHRELSTFPGQVHFEPVYAALAPALWGPPPQAWYLPAGPLPDLIAGSSLFGPILHEAYTWTEVVTPAALLRQLATRSDPNMLPPERREALFAGLRAALQLEEALEQRHESHLYMAQRSSTV